MAFPVRVAVVTDRGEQVEAVWQLLIQSGLEPSGECLSTQVECVSALQRPQAARPELLLIWHPPLPPEEILALTQVHAPEVSVVGLADTAADLPTPLPAGLADWVFWGEVPRVGVTLRRLVELQRLRAEKSQTDAALRESETRLRLLNGILIGVTSGLTVEAIIQRTVKRLAQAFPGLRVSYAVVDAQGEMRWLDSVEPAPRLSLRGASLSLRDLPEYLGAVRRRELVNVEDVQAAAGLAPVADWLLSHQTGSLLDVCLAHSATLTGVLRFDQPSVHEWTEHEAATLTEIADYLSIAVQEVVAQQERRRVEEQLQHHTQRLAMLAQMGQAVVSSLELDATLRLVVNTVYTLLGADGASVELLSEDKEWLEFAAVSGIDSGDLLGQRFPSTEGISGSALRSGSSQLVRAPFGPDVFPSFRVQGLAGFRPQTYLAVPLRWRGELIGVMGAVHSQPGKFSDSDLRLLEAAADWAAIAIGNARLFAETREALLREKQLGEVTRIISGALELPVILPQVVRLAVELVGAEAGALALLDSLGDTLTYPYVFNLPAQLVETPAKRDTSLAWVVVKDQRPLLVPDYATHPQANPDFVAARVRAFLGIPLLANEVCLGVLGLFGFNPEKRFTERDSALAESVGRQAGIAIQNARLFETQRRRVAALTALHQTGLDLSAQLDLSALLHVIVERAAAMLEAPMGGLYLLSPDGDTLELTVSVTGQTDYAGTHLRRGQGVAGQVVQNGAALIISDYPHWPLRAEVYENAAFRSVIGVPIRWQNQILGVLDVMDSRPSRFGQEDVEIVSLFADQAAVAIVNARQHASLRRRLQESEAMASISRALTETLNTEQIFRMIVDAAKRIIPQVEQAVIHQLDQEKQALRPAAVAGVDTAGRPEVTMRPGEGVAGQVMAEGVVINVSDTLTDRRYLPLGRTPRLRSLLVAPVQSGQRRLGTISVQSTAPNAFSADDEWLLATLGVQAALAIENARLFEQNTRLVSDLEKALQQEKTARAQMVQSEKLAAMGRLVASVAHELNNPLQAIQNALYLVRQEKNLTAQARDDLQVASSETERMAELISRLRDTYRPVTREEYQLESLNLLIEDMRRLIATHLRHNNIQLVVETDPALPLIRGLRDQLKQALLNLSLNAVEAMPDGGRLTIRTRPDAHTGGIWLVINDTGHGIPPEALPNVFDPFFTTKETGTGLGLAITHDVVRRHGGRIEVQSTVGQGTTFSIWLPV